MWVRPLLKSQPHMKKSPYLLSLVAAAILGVSAGPATARDDKPKLDRALKHAVSQNGTGSLDVIIRLVPGAHEGVRARLAAKGHAITGEHASINALSATVD